MVDRIKQIMEYYQLAPATFAEQIGINRSNLTHLFSGRNQPSLDLAKKILHCFPDIKTEWLIMGVGEMFRNSEEKELTLKMINEKKLQLENEEPDLFTQTQLEKTNVNKRESLIEKQIDTEVEIINSHETEKPKVSKSNQPVEKENPPPPSHSTESTVQKIIFFYSDNRFEIYQPK